MSSFNICQTSTKCSTQTHYGDTVWGWCLGKFIESVTRAIQSILNSRPIKVIIYHFILKLRKNSWFRKILVFRNNFWWVKFCENSFSYRKNSLTGNILFEISFVWQILLQWNICLFDYYASLLRYYHINLDSSQYTFSKSNNLMHGRNHLLVKNCQKRLSYLWYRMNSLKS